ncbi:MAG: bifunctional glutamate N-acetyltransferase/amino-acid acetyltransferase ArgJ [Bacteroidetes bacterium]|jgi:glutamate N-acetyltransferase/amino-acid N-acetyltransferase|nr:bifunctional glutamate N-acetyltransferase/amino-acid acetyltransferase ArgJ [Bacteroidota bacterium]
MTISPLAPAKFPVMPPISGLRLSTAASGLKYSGRDDLMLMRFADTATLAGVFTRSDAAAAPVQWSRDLLQDESLSVASRAPMAILVNAGNANAFTAAAGLEVVATCCTALASRMGCAPTAVMMASTGVIGEPLNAAILEAKFDELVADESTWQDAAKAIMTTDTFPKGAATHCQIGGQTITIAGIAKGSGMIAPNMATMLGFIATDAKLPRAVLNLVLRDAANRSFNAITVDSDTSTNDSVFLLASGAVDHIEITDANDPELADFRGALDDVMQDLAQQIVRDGEGASKFITIDVAGTDDDETAHQIGLAIANSPLVKTAAAGEDANWGRIVMAIGKSGLGIDPAKIGISIGGVLVAANGARIAAYDEDPVTRHMKGTNIDIAVVVGDGPSNARIWTCDLTAGYISINADYRS